MPLATQFISIFGCFTTLLGSKSCLNGHRYLGRSIHKSTDKFAPFSSNVWEMSTNGKEKIWLSLANTSFLTDFQTCHTIWTSFLCLILSCLTEKDQGFFFIVGFNLGIENAAQNIFKSQIFQLKYPFWTILCVITNFHKFFNVYMEYFTCIKSNGGASLCRKSATRLCVENYFWAEQHPSFWWIASTPSFANSQPEQILHHCHWQ